LEWFAELPAKAQDKCFLRLERLSETGHELRRRAADFLRDGIYELRVSLRGLQYRILHFFHGTIAAVVSHGLIKERVVPPKEIERALERRKRFIANPAKHNASGVLTCQNGRNPPATLLKSSTAASTNGKPNRLKTLEEARANQDIAQKIYELRNAAGLTQAQLGKLIARLHR
jgi:phage-related protein